MNKNDSNLPRGLVSVHHYKQTNSWTHSQARPPIETWPSYAAATVAAVEWIKTHPEIPIRGVTGHPDVHVLREAGIQRIDSRGNRRQSLASARKTWDRRSAERVMLGKPPLPPFDPEKAHK